jgi:hypothetical protein
MKFSEIANRLTGISTPFGGASWQPADMEIAAARRVIAFLEDRRVLGIHHANGWGFHSWTFGSALGELRGTFGVQVARIAAAFKLDVEDRLASIVPANAEADAADDDRLFRRLYL